MKNFLKLLSVLICSLLCTACINNLAIQELNQMGVEYLQKGDIDSAISRLESSVDLDENVFETRYNLGVAYTKKEEYKKAINELKAAVNLKPDSYEANYAYAVSLEFEGFLFEQKLLDAQIEDEITKVKASKEEIKNSLEFANEALEVYEKCASLATNNEEIEKLNFHIKELQSRINETKEEYLGNKEE